MNLDPDCTLNYSVGHEAWAWRHEPGRNRYVRVGSDSNGGGCAWEFMVEEHVFTGRESALRVGMFDDAWVAYEQVPELFAALAAERPQTFPELIALLDRIGAKDDTARQPPAGYEASAIRRRILGKAVHHIDGDPMNNDPGNLRIVDLEDHAPSRPAEEQQ